MLLFPGRLVDYGDDYDSKRGLRPFHVVSTRAGSP